jgi:demethylspheroidene O-methyltransferase
MIEHHRHLYGDLRDPVALLRGAGPETELGKYWPYAGAKRPAELGTDEVADYSSLMALSQPLVAEEILDAYSLIAHRCLLDVGGGEGAFLASAAARAPDLQLMLFDLPAVAARAKERLSEQGLAGRCSVFGGDFFSEPLPAGADVISLVRIVLDHDDAKVMKLLRSVHAALGKDGVLLLAEPMSEPVAGEPMGAAYFGLYLLAMGRGRPRTRDELRALLTAAGFRSVSFRKGRRVLQTGIAVAKP